MKAFERFDKQFFPVLGLILLLPMLVASYLFAQKDMTYPQLDLRVYKRAADFLFAGQSTYSSQFTTGDFTLLPWVYTPFGTLFVAPLHLIPDALLFIVWTTLAIILPVTVVVLVAYQAYLRRPDLTRGHKIAALTIFSLIGMLVGPVLDVVVLGQIGALITAAMLFDLAAPNTWFQRGKFKLPRGVLTGIVGAIKLIPLISIPYWIVTKQWRAAVSATLTAAACWTLAFILLPSDSMRYVSEGLFLGTTSLDQILTEDNQSLIGLVTRLIGDGALPVTAWAPITAGTVLIGLMIARAAYRNGDMLSAGIIVGLTSVLASPVSWVHHIVWIAAIPGVFLAGRSMRNSVGKVSKAGWLWFGLTLIVVFPPLRYGWSPLFWFGVTEQYNLLSILLIVALWWRSKQMRISQAEVHVEGISAATSRLAD